MSVRKFSKTIFTKIYFLQHNIANSFAAQTQEKETYEDFFREQLGVSSEVSTLFLQILPFVSHDLPSQVHFSPKIPVTLHPFATYG
jgi:hypothetical protein